MKVSTLPTDWLIVLAVAWNQVLLPSFKDTKSLWRCCYPFQIAVETSVVSYSLLLRYQFSIWYFHVFPYIFKSHVNDYLYHKRWGVCVSCHPTLWPLWTWQRRRACLSTPAEECRCVQKTWYKVEGYYMGCKRFTYIFKYISSKMTSFCNLKQQFWGGDVFVQLRGLMVTAFPNKSLESLLFTSKLPCHKWFSNVFQRWEVEGISFWCLKEIVCKGVVLVIL